MWSWLFVAQLWVWLLYPYGIIAQQVPLSMVFSPVQNPEWFATSSPVDLSYPGLKIMWPALLRFFTAKHQSLSAKIPPLEASFSFDTSVGLCEPSFSPDPGNNYSVPPDIQRSKPHSVSLLVWEGCMTHSDERCTQKFYCILTTCSLCKSEFLLWNPWG